MFGGRCLRGNDLVRCAKKMIECLVPSDFLLVFKFKSLPLVPFSVSIFSVKPDAWLVRDRYVPCYMVISNIQSMAS